MLKSRRMMLKWSMAAGLCVCLPAGCIWMPLEPVAAAVVSNTSDTRVTLARAGTRTVVEVYSPRGTGHSRITLVDPLPGPLEFRLHLAGLEHFSLAYAGTIVRLAVATHAGTPVLVTVQTAGEPEASVAPDGPHRMIVYIPVSGTADPVYRVVAPPDISRRRPQVFEIEWIDFYR
jgi:hypothetical protein